MAKNKGRGWLLQIRTDDDPETWGTVGGFESNDLDLATEAVEVTDKGSSGNRELLFGAGTKSRTFSGSGFRSSDANYALLQTAANDGTEVVLRMISTDGADKWTGSFLATSLQISGEHNGAETFTVTLESSGAITKAAYSV
jgi:predicted secreted protein